MAKPTQADVTNMTAERALDLLVDLDVSLWGESERDASRRMHARKSRGLLINSIIHHKANEHGKAFDAGTKRAAGEQLSADDETELREGG